MEYKRLVRCSVGKGLKEDYVRAQENMFRTRKVNPIDSFWSELADADRLENSEIHKVRASIKARGLARKNAERAKVALERHDASCPKCRGAQAQKYTHNRLGKKAESLLK